jgi:hypothetical protein
VPGAVAVLSGLFLADVEDGKAVFARLFFDPGAGEVALAVRFLDCDDGREVPPRVFGSCEKSKGVVLVLFLEDGE